MKSRVRKIRLPAGHTRAVGTSFSDERWSRIRAAIPDPLTEGQEERLREAVGRCCDDFLSQARLIEEGAATAAAVRRGGGKQVSPLERLTSSLKVAAVAWAEIRAMHDDHRGILSDHGDSLVGMAADADRRLKAIQKIPEIKPKSARAEFVRNLATCFHIAGLTPTATGRVSQHEKPSWFQCFIAELNDQVLGQNGWGNMSSRSIHSDIAKALSGSRKAGNPPR